MQFEWDEPKRRANLEKHGLDFADAVAVFGDPRAIVTVDARRNYGEVRLRVIGRVGDTVVAVVFTDRSGLQRVISARRASRREREAYRARDL